VYVSKGVKRGVADVRLRFDPPGDWTAADQIVFFCTFSKILELYGFVHSFTTVLYEFTSCFILS